jgi:hypothetical protein
MSDERTGVAQRILDQNAVYRERLEARIPDPENAHAHYMALAIHDAFTDALKAAIDELSTEARAILAGPEDARIEARCKGRDENPFKWEYGILRDAFTRLGLDIDIEQEDE